jgi:hypothetical protein
VFFLALLQNLDVYPQKPGKSFICQYLRLSSFLFAHKRVHIVIWNNRLSISNHFLFVSNYRSIDNRSSKLLINLDIDSRKKYRVPTRWKLHFPQVHETTRLIINCLSTMCCPSERVRKIWREGGGGKGGGDSEEGAGLSAGCGWWQPSEWQNV